ncbi:nitroreductase family protein [Dactylosporangium sp. AC04546]|uniref:Acg family FMN-binding oxidoreductase n=1 Tax=Dactylosporangium sp. AC04546 TaxID=2862460 RepID=UPI001EDCA11A|nr:nitroreductase family protein [Dactylosporangium sp. AC04546]WVK78546.1 nitroreductase family protein [Dactylosporangium sp. AC04546]
MTTNEPAAALHRAAEDALLAPSILNTQPWHWRVEGANLDLYADPARQLHAADPHWGLMVVSCGAALHHARVSLRAGGYEPVVHRRPDPHQPWLLARIQAGRACPPSPASLRTYQSLRLRHTDRRAFATDVRVPAAVIAGLRSAAEAEHAHLYQLAPQAVEYLRYAAQGARTAGARDKVHTAELRDWTSRGADDGVPPETVAKPAARPVPTRDFGLGSEAALDPGPGDDRAAEYLVVATAGDDPTDWLHAGEATSAVWLAATVEGLAISPMSDVIEVPGARTLLRSLLHPTAQPQLVLRAGVAGDADPPPQSPRRPASEAIDVT